MSVQFLLCLVSSSLNLQFGTAVSLFWSRQVIHRSSVEGSDILHVFNITAVPGGRCKDPAGASACGRRIGRGQGSCSPHTAASSQGPLDPRAPEPSSDRDPLVWKYVNTHSFQNIFSVETSCKFSYCLGDFSRSSEEPMVGTWLNSWPMISWVMSSLQVRPATGGQKCQLPALLLLLIVRERHPEGNPPCTIRSLRTSWSLCRTCTDTWYWTGSWWGARHCPNSPSAQTESHTSHAEASPTRHTSRLWVSGESC